jgi:hypothetical protein
MAGGPDSGSIACDAGSLSEGEHAASITTAIAGKERNFIEIHLNAGVVIIKILGYQNKFRNLLFEACK